MSAQPNPHLPTEAVPPLDTVPTLSVPPPPAVPALVAEPTYRRIITLAGPLVLSSTGMMIMQVIDAIFLAHYSQAAMAASVVAGLAGWSASGLFVGIAGYTSVFVAQYIGAGRPERAGPAVWQGVWFALASGVVIALIGLAADWLFSRAGHDPALWPIEAQYFRILCLGGGTFVVGSALSGFFAGRGDSLTLAFVQLAGVGVNAVCSWALIFGRWGLPECGAAGAAIGTVIGQAVVCAGLGLILLLPRHGREFGTRNARVEWSLVRRLMRYGVPAGVRMMIEISVWTLFTVLVGRLGTDAQAATGLVFRVNSVAFFPMFGVGMAISTLVGQSQGARRPDLGQRATWRGLVVAQVWMLTAGALFVLVPRPLLAVFHEASGPDAAAWARTIELSVILLRFVAVYCLLDGVNVVVASALQGAGDTTWTLVVSSAMHAVFLAVLWFVQRSGGGVYLLWATATTFVLLVALVMLARFQTGRWKTMSVVEQAVNEV